MAHRDDDNRYPRPPSGRDFDDRPFHPDRESENWGSAYGGPRAAAGSYAGRCQAPQEQGGWAGSGTASGHGDRGHDDRSAWERQNEGGYAYDYDYGGRGGGAGGPRRSNYGYGSDEFADDYGHRQFGDGSATAGSFYGNRDRFPGGRAPQRSQAHHDPDYLQWRNEQLRSLDSDYESWRRERYQKFSEDFNTWRSQRATQNENVPAAQASASASLQPSTPVPAQEPGDAAAAREEGEEGASATRKA